MTVTIGNELNLSNRNFCTFMSALGVDYDPENLVGELDTCEILQLLDNFDPSLALRETIAHGNVVDFGIEMHQIDRYCTILRQICSQKPGKVTYG